MGIIDSVRSVNSPSKAAKLENFDKDQQIAQIYCHRPPDNVGRPVIWFNNAFSGFKANYNNESLLLPKKLNQQVLEFVKEMAMTYDKENDRQDILDSFLSEALGLNFNTVQLSDGSSNDGCLLQNNNYLVAIREIKNEIGLGQSDPFLQASFSYFKFWAQNKINIYMVN